MPRDHACVRQAAEEAAAQRQRVRDATAQRRNAASDAASQRTALQRAAGHTPRSERPRKPCGVLGAARSALCMAQLRELAAVEQRCGESSHELEVLRNKLLQA
jgi:hypothetical protein